MMPDDIITRDSEGQLAVNTVSSTEANVPYNYDDCFTIDTNGRRALRVVGAGGGGDSHNKGYYATPEALAEAYPTAEAGDYAIVGSTDTVWIWDSDTNAWKDSDQKGQVVSVNNKTGDVVLNAEDVNALPQYDTMPTASVSTVGEIVQYTGTTDANYTHGYIYEGVGGGQPASATITQTVGENLSNLAIDLETFEEHEEPTGNETLTFQYVEYDEYPQGTIQQGWTGGFTIDPTDFSESILTELGWDMDFDLGDVVTVSLEDTGNNEYTLTLSMAGKQTQTYTGLEGIELGDYGITLNGNPSVGQTCIKTIEHVWGEEWRLDGISVDVADYGITYTGTPEDGNEIQVVYTAGSGSAYAWQQINVQPESVPVTPSTMPTLAVADWSSNTQTVTVSGVTSSNVVFVAPAPASAADYAAAGIVCTAQGTDSLTFTCDTVPSNDIVVNVVIFG